MAHCPHHRTDFVYRRDGIDYVRCRECSAVLDAEDLVELVSAYDGEEQPAARPKR